MRSLGLVVLGLAVLPATAFAAEPSRSLSWRVLDVAAELDADGRLLVRERHHMVFTGDWNGGYREFNLRRGQAVALRRISRLDPLRGTRDLRENNPPDVDEYFWANRRRLQWRSRRPSDPPFRSTELVYELEYTLTGALGYRDGVYRLDHEFVLLDRPGPIDRFVLDFRLDPAWRPAFALPARAERQNLGPGAGHVVRSDLRHLGARPPAAVDHGSPGGRAALLAALVLGALMRASVFRRGERDAGRLEPAVAEGAIDTAWLEKHVLAAPAEVVGAAWDRSVGGSEVAATLARLEAERKIRTWSGTGEVQFLELLVPRTALANHERPLLDALLVKGGDETDTRAVQRHYRDKGFDPAATIRPALEAQVRAWLGADQPGGARWVPTLILFLIGVALLAVGVIRDDVEAVLLAGLTLALWVVAFPWARRWRRRVDSAFPTVAGFAIPIVLVVAAAVYVLGVLAPIGLAGLAGSVALALAVINSILNQARTRESRETVLLRKRLASARAFLERELRRGSPEIRPEWFPHLLALGLASEADRWSAAQPARDTGTEGFSGSTSSSGSGGSSRPVSFEPGGGRFGGAGATGSWAAAAHAFSASVAAPSSDSGGSGGSSSGGSSGGSSSGGGGGGGW
jgi:hypothetical protein